MDTTNNSVCSNASMTRGEAGENRARKKALEKATAARTRCTTDFAHLVTPRLNATAVSATEDANFNAMVTPRRTAVAGGLTATSFGATRGGIGIDPGALFDLYSLFANPEYRIGACL